MFHSIKEGLIISVTFWLVGLIIVGGVHVMMKGRHAASFPAVPADSWQAVFLENGQVYFGKLAEEGREYVSLSNVYYLKEASDLQQSNLNLVKLGGELHGPEDTIHIRKESISFWENMKDTSRVVQSIEGAQR